MVMAWIINATNKDLNSSISQASTTHDIWINLKEIFVHINTLHIHQLWRMFTTERG